MRDLAAKILPSVALLSVSLGLAALVGEVVIRMRLGPPVHFRFPQESYIEDADIGHWLKPDQRAFTHDEPVEVNSVGIRDRDYPREIPPGTRRILALGDSQTFGNGLAQQDTWPKLLERHLNERDENAPRWEVLNGGICGSDTWQHEHVFRRLAESYDFDAVILAFYVNDVTPRYTPPPAEELTNTTSKRLAYLLKRSGILSLLLQTYRVALAGPGPGDRELRMIRGESDEAIEEGWAQVERSLVAMQELARELSVDFSVLVIPRRDQVSGREAGRVYNERIAEITARHGIPSVDVLPALEKAYATNGSALFIPWDGHNTAIANEVIARESVRRAGELSIAATR